jgi:hypothetical protein
MQRRLTDDERSAVSVVMFWQRKLEEGGITASGQKVYEQMLAHNTTDGLPYVEPPLTDEDARQRPWVMVRDDESDGWHGPRILAARCSSNYYSFTPSKSAIVGFRYARRATAEEIASAGLEVTE